MSTLGGTVLNLADWAKRLDPNGNTADVINLLSQDNEMLEDMIFVESNGPTSHRTTVVTGEPSVDFRVMNTGVTPSKSTTAQVDETMGTIATYSEIDRELCELNGNTAAFRLSETQPFLSSINKLAQAVVLYGDATSTPNRFNGFAAPNRYYTLSASSYSNQMLDGGGSGSDNTSIWLVVWGPNTVHGIFPKGSTAGIKQEDKGVVTVTTAATNGIGVARMEAYRTYWEWKLGLAVRDPRYVVRICNIDVSALVAESSQANLIKLMSRSLDRIPSFGMGRPVFYMNRTVYSMLRIQAMSQSNYALAIENSLDQFGNPKKGMMQFSGIPIRRVDQLLTSEGTVTR